MRSNRPDGSEFADQSVVAAYRHRPPIPAEILTELQQLIPMSCQTVLDAGCGTGVVARSLADQVDHVDAVDPSAEMIAQGQQTPSSAKISWVIAPMETAELQPPYGLIVCAGSLHWMDLDIVMPRFSESLHPEGHLAIVSQYEATTPWAGDLAQVITRHSSNRDDHRYGLFPRIIEDGNYQQVRYLRSASVPTRQRICDYIESLHSRTGLSRDRMDNPEGFDADTESLLSKHAVGDILHFDIIGQMSWGKPGPRGAFTTTNKAWQPAQGQQDER